MFLAVVAAEEDVVVVVVVLNAATVVAPAVVLVVIEGWTVVDRELLQFHRTVLVPFEPSFEEVVAAVLVAAVVSAVPVVADGPN